MPKLSRKILEQEKENTIPPVIQEEDDFDPMATYGHVNMPPPNLEKQYSPSATPEEIYRAEMDMIKGSIANLPETITKYEEEEENPVGTPQTAILPQQAPPSNALIPRTEEEEQRERVWSPLMEQPPQIPGAASQPTSEPQKPMNPLAGYQPPAQSMKPESGLPWKPPGGGGGFGKGLSRPVTQPVAHDCVTVHGFQAHEDWEAAQKRKPFFRA